MTLLPILRYPGIIAPWMKEISNAFQPIQIEGLKF